MILKIPIKRITTLFLISTIFISSFIGFLPSNNRVYAASPPGGSNFVFYDSLWQINICQYKNISQSQAEAACGDFYGSLPKGVSQGDFNLFIPQGPSGSSYLYVSASGSSKITVPNTAPTGTVDGSLSSGSNNYPISIPGYPAALNSYNATIKLCGTKCPSISGVISTGAQLSGPPQTVTVNSTIYDKGTSIGQLLGPITYNLTDASGNKIASVTSSTQNIKSLANGLEQGANFSTNFPNINPGVYYISSPAITSSPVSVTVPGNTTVELDGNFNVASVVSSTQSPTCESSGGPLAWIGCAVITLLANTVHSIEGFVSELLTTQTLNLSPPNCSSGQICSQSDQTSYTIYHIWSSFRIIGDILLVIGLLVVVFAESIGGGLIDAYSIRKILPRLIAVAILINLSIYIVAALLDITNILGKGVFSLLVSPFSNLPNQPSSKITGGTSVILSLGMIGLIGGVVTEGIMGIAVMIFGAAFLAVIGVLVTIMFRQGLIFLLLMISPVAFALYVLPNTEQYFKKWWDLLIKTLMVYPIVMIVFAVASISGYIVTNMLGNNPLTNIMGLLATVAPLFLIPFAFKMSGGAIGSAHGLISNARSKVTAPMSNWRKQNRANRLQRAKEGNLMRGDNRFSRRVSSIAQGAVLAPRAGLDPRKMRSKLRNARGEDISAAISEVGKNSAAAAVMGNDQLLNAALHGNRTDADARAYLEQQGVHGQILEDNVNAIANARRAVGRQNFDAAAVVANAGTGTGFAGGPAEMLEAINSIAGSNRALAGRMYNNARQSAERAKRTDLYGSSFGDGMRGMESLYNNPTAATRETVNADLTDSAYASKGAPELATQRNGGLANMQGAITRSINNAQYGLSAAHSALQSARAGGNAASIHQAESTLSAAQDNYVSALAKAEELTRSYGQSTQNSDLIKNIEVESGGRQVRLSDFLTERKANDPLYRQYAQQRASIPDAELATRNRPPNTEE